jgi:hypothetical protein
MFHKFKITTCAFILCLFGLTLMTVSPVFAADSAAFKQCQQIKPHGKFGPMKQKKNCFRDLARALNVTHEEQEPETRDQTEELYTICDFIMEESKFKFPEVNGVGMLRKDNKYSAAGSRCTTDSLGIKEH